jgi:predicted nucleic acid-binding protein
VNVLLDTSVWVDHLRTNALGPIMARIRSEHRLWLDAVVRAELIAGCSSKEERSVVSDMVKPLRELVPNRIDYERAALALSRLRAGGVQLRNPGAALLDALQAADSVRIGALLVTNNVSDFSRLAAYIPCRVEPFERFRRSLWQGSSS